MVAVIGMAEPAAGSGDEGESTMINFVVWAVRILLPIILFWVYVKFSPQDDDAKPVKKRRGSGLSAAAPFTGKSDAKNRVYSRVLLVKMRPVKETQNKDSIILAEADPAETRGRSHNRSRDEASRRERREEKDKMQLESLVNYVAFKDKDKDKDRRESRARSASPETHSAAPRTDRQEGKRANAEAQIVLNGAVQFGRVDVAQQLYHQLTESGIEIAARTYELMIEASLSARDLPAVSDFLVRMESEGHRPKNSGSILKRVVRLREDLSREQEESARQAAETAEREKTPLRSTAAPFFGAPSDLKRTPLTAAAQPFHTSLSVNATPFVPGEGEGAKVVPPPPPPGPPPEPHVVAPPLRWSSLQEDPDSVIWSSTATGSAGGSTGKRDGKNIIWKGSSSSGRTEKKERTGAGVTLWRSMWNDQGGEGNAVYLETQKKQLDSSEKTAGSKKRSKSADRVFSGNVIKAKNTYTDYDPTEILYAVAKDSREKKWVPKEVPPQKDEEDKSSSRKVWVPKESTSKEKEKSGPRQRWVPVSKGEQD